MIKVLTVEREYGSGGNEIARTISEHLGWKLWDQLLTAEIAGSLECDRRHIESQEERRDPLYYRLVKAFLRGSLEGGFNAQMLKIADADGIRGVTERIVRRAARDGSCVIVGRGSAYYLHGVPDAFHVFVYAPFEERVRRLQETGKTKRQAISLLQTIDLDRAAFAKAYFGGEWPARDRYHMMINSAIGNELLVQMVLDGMKTLQQAQP